MVSEKELRTLIAKAEAKGAHIVVTHDQKIHAEEGRTLIASVQISGVQGFGPSAMNPIDAAERLREFLAR